MNLEQWSIWLVLIGVGVAICLAIWLGLRFSRVRSQEKAEKLQSQAMKRLAAQQKVAERKAAEQKVVEGERALRTSAEKLAEKRTVAEQRAAERAAQEKAALEQAIAEWAAAEQAETERLQLHHANETERETKQMEAHMEAVEAAIAEWMAAERESSGQLVVATSDKLAGKNFSRVEAIHEQIRFTAEKVQKEMQDMEFIKNRIETGVDFLPLEFKQTVDQWKQGHVFRHKTFDDLKLKFRYKAYSIEDGYEVLYRYGEWLDQQRQKLRVFIRLLGTPVNDRESIQAAIERAEHNEHEKYLEMNMEIVFALRDIREVLAKLIEMESIHHALEDVCRKRSEQIIAPSWEAKGSL